MKAIQNSVSRGWASLGERNTSGPSSEHVRTVRARPAARGCTRRGIGTWSAKRCVFPAKAPVPR
eukprot:5862154-Prymnesium_polylepis.1